MLDCQIAILENAIARYFATGVVPGPLGARHPSITPFAAFRTGDRYIVIAAGNDRLFARLCDTIGRADLVTNPLFGSNELRTQHADALKDEIEQALAARGSEEWLRIFESSGVPCGPINDIAHALADPQIAARNMVVTVEDETAGTLHTAGNPIKMSGFPDPKIRAAAPELGRDQARVLGDAAD